MEIVQFEPEIKWRRWITFRKVFSLNSGLVFLCCTEKTADFLMGNLMF